jgi:hypothetical protein
MKQRLYSIVLLLSFLIVLAHDAIPHQHHDVHDVVFSFPFKGFNNHKHSHGPDHCHHPDGRHQQGDQNGNGTGHKHEFPTHHHLNGEDYHYLRNQEVKETIVFFTLIAVIFTQHNITSPFFGEVDTSPLRVRPFIPAIMFQSAAVGLRAPPPPYLAYK